MEEFRHRLKRIRERRGMSQRALSELCGVSSDMVGLYERGKRKPNIDTLKEMCRVLDVSADYLLGISEKYE